MSNLLGDKNYIDKLINAISVDEAIKSFSVIDEKIKDLINCSTDDFLSLNDHFKSYHKESKNISQNASNIIQTITEPKLNDSFNALKSIAENFNSLSNTFTNKVELLDVELKKAVNKIENLKIKHNNYRQDLSSIKVLLANNMAANHPNIDRATCDSIEKEVVAIKQLLSSADELANNLIDKATECYLFLTNIKKDNYDHLSLLNDNIEVGFSLFNKKYKEASQFFVSLKEQTDRNSTNIARIITNLQYHDIIRQKIEHIQRTHKDIITELKSFQVTEPGMSLIHNKVKTFLKIRDVAGLQAAQLIHANNQYQVAIDEISKNLEEIGNDMITISSMCDNLVGKSEQAKDYYLNNIVENLNIALTYNHKLIELVAEIKKQTGQLDLIKNKLNDTYSEIQKHKNKIEKIAQQSVENSTGGADINLTQIVNLLKEIEELRKNLGTVQDDLDNKLVKFFDLDSTLNGNTNILQSYNAISTAIPGLIELLKHSTTKVDEYLYVNSTISLSISDSIRNSLNNFRYYVMFEKACDVIIEELNTINLKLNEGDEMSDKNREENLKHLKSRYTMASEHIIHDHLSKLGDFSNLTEQNTEQIINLANQNSNDEDDNLELF